MSDPLLQPTPPGSADAPAEHDKEARIEQLLLSGLDCYFAGDYEQAINIWTRVAFLERGHNRARAYIERARSALAERHRESEEMLHQGLAAFNRGETDAARDLITRAAEQGAPQDVAMVLLERLNRLNASGAAVEPPQEAVARRQIFAADDASPRPTSGWWLRGGAAVAILAGAAAIAVLSGLPVPDWLADPAGSPRAQTVVPPPDPLPMARSSERLVARARALQSGGRLYDALRVLDGVGFSDPLRPEADRLRAEIQRRLLALSAGADR